ncbi:MAG: GntR family transcriptional regulator [Peptoclostridium sp.]|uniref:GntR family transcriptional regulator n=1 Tax=Peptoclostridium sp. TaxID=1904860 RepID=UPI00139DEDD1|nr:GntR family transcriptional regulator [Peptoclostridium sp.]MZQ75870.1 GntR family transcriptional regulator [Peptoclostridium sp.]
MFELDLRSRVPIYEQLVEKLKKLIISDMLRENEQLPAVRTLAKELTINPNTIQKAYRELERQGYIYSIPGKGSFVSESKSGVNIEKMNELKAELEKIVSELIFMGTDKGELIELIENVGDNGKRGEGDD